MFQNLVQVQRALVVEVRRRSRPPLYVPFAVGQVVRIRLYDTAKGGYPVRVGGGVGVLPLDAVEEIPESPLAWALTAHSSN